MQPKARGGYRRSRLADHDGLLRQWIDQEPDLSLAQMRERLLEQLDIRIGTTALWHRLEKLQLSYEPISNSFQVESKARKFHKAKEIGAIIVPSLSNSPRPLQPRKGSFHGETSPHSPQRSAILCACSFPVLFMWGNHFNARLLQVFVQFVGIKSGVSDQAFRSGFDNRKIEC